MGFNELITLAEREWDLDSGFLGKLRQGQFDRQAYGRFRQMLEKVRTETRDADQLPRRLVSLIWYVPQFMYWQVQRVKGSISLEEYEKAVNEMSSAVEEILGVP